MRKLFFELLVKSLEKIAKALPATQDSKELVFLMTSIELSKIPRHLFKSLLRISLGREVENSLHFRVIEMSAV